MKILNKLFYFQEQGASLKWENIGALVTFASIIYILPVNAALLSSAGVG